MKVVILLSGGMDSTSLLYYAYNKHEVVAALSFDYGSKHNDRELPFAKYHCEKLSIPHTTIPLGFISDYFSSDLLKSGGEIPEGHYEDQNMVKTVVPFRNGIMLSVATGFAESVEAEAVGIAAHAGDHTIYPDCRTDFMAAFSESMKAGTYAKIELMKPFLDIRKEDIVKVGLDHGVDFSQTWSCYKGGDKHCGKCGTCVERIEAFELAGIEDPTDYL